MQSTPSLFLRTTLRRTAPTIIRARPYATAPEASSSSSQAVPEEPSTSTSTSSDSASASTSPSTSAQTSSSSPIIPSTSSTAEYVRTHGIPGFLPRESFENVERWVGGHWDRLEGEMQSNETLRNLLASRSARSSSSSSSVDIVTLLSETARDPGCSVAFNSASLILNTSFFLEKLTRTGEVQPLSRGSGIPKAMEHLEDQLVGRARGMVGGGFLWLVRMKEAPGAKGIRYEIMPTHAAGTLLVRNRLMMGRGAQTDLFRPTNASDESSSSTQGVYGESDNQTPGQGASAHRGNLDPEHLRVTPLACVSLFEHVYLPKYGVNGKEAYVRDWFKHLDWRSIERN